MSAKESLWLEQILSWADAHRARLGSWPSGKSGPVAGVPGLTWSAIEDALRRGYRGMPGGDSLARLLNRHRSLQRRSC
jgi:hypothetical protein